MDKDKAKKYDAKHGKDAYHYRHTKSGQAQSKAYDAYFAGGKKSSSKDKALTKKKGKMVKVSHKGDIGHRISDIGKGGKEHNVKESMN